MSIALVILPTYTNKSVPLGLACINGALRQAGAEVTVHDLDLELSAGNFELYSRLHHHAWSGDPKTVNFLGSTDTDLVFHSVFDNREGLGALGRRDPRALKDVEEALCWTGEAMKRILDGGATEVWFSTFVSNLWPTMLAARAVRNLDPRVRLIFGGPGVFDEPVRALLLGNGLADVCVVGEGELTAAELVRAGKGEKVTGAAVIRDGKISYTPRPPADPDQLPRPDYTGFPWPGGNLSDYLQRGFEGLPISFSRGCVNRCVFCTEQKLWGRFRSRSPESVVQEMKQLRDSWGVSLFYCCDSLVNFSARWLERFCTLVIDQLPETAFSFAFIQGARLPRPLLDLMRRAGFSRLFLGAEHGSRRMLQLMGKHTAPDEMVQVVVDAVLAGLSLRVQCIVNFPGETPQDLVEQAAFFRDVDEALASQGVPPRGLPQRLLANTFRLEPASDVYQRPEDFGVRIIDLPAGGHPEVQHAAGVLKRWELEQPHDESLHLYLVSKLSFHRDPWAVAPADHRRFAAGIHRLILPEHRLVQTPGTRVARDPSSGRAMVEHQGERMPLDGEGFETLKLLAGGKSVGETADPGRTARLAAEFHTRGILRLVPHGPPVRD
jgi:radical SAM superfamily enzyme YgiQ (UPF0313 family)